MKIYLKYISPLFLLITLSISNCFPNSIIKHKVILDEARATVWASSELKGRKNLQYSVLNLFDNNLKTAWVEGVKGNGIGESIHIEFETPQDIYGLEFRPGYLKTERTFHNNALPFKVSFKFDQEEFHSYIPYQQEFDYALSHCIAKKNQTIYLPKFFLFEKPRKIKSFSITIKAALQGLKYTDLAISELRFLTNQQEHFKINHSPEAAENYFQKFQPKYGYPHLGKVLDTHPQEFWKNKERFKSMNKQEKTAKYKYSVLMLDFTNAAELMKTMKNAFFNTIVIKNKNFWVSSNIKSKGDGEWIEAFPQIHTDAKNNVLKLSYGFSIDGAPGCHFDLPPSPK